MKRAIKIFLLSGLALALVGFGWLWFAPCGLGGCAPVSDLEKYQAEGSALLDVEGRPFATLATVNRRVVSLDSVPDYLPRAFVAIEDRRFYDHGGVDWQRMGGAVKATASSLAGRGGGMEGGSTITMQLARNLFPERLSYRDRSIRRKVMEMRVARQIERAFPKDKILELYVNHIYLGEGAYGVDAAARAYFGKPAAEISLAEAAALAATAQTPARVNPRENREATRRRRDLVLTEMQRAGYVTAQEAAEAREQPIRLARSVRAERQQAPYFVERVRRELEELVGDGFYTEGLRVYTTLDPDAQRAAEEELAQQLDAVESGRFGAYRHPTYAQSKGEAEDGQTAYLQGVAIVMDVRTGEVRALVGGRDYDDSKYDRAFQAQRQPGSAFKPFVYLAALDRGQQPTRRVEDAPLRITLAGGRTWEPRNYTGTYDGPMTLRDALTRSKNTVAVRVAQEVGMDAVAGEARSLGITTPIPANPAVALGSAEVRPAELAGAYAAFANGGRRVEPHVIRRVEDRHGDVVWEAPTRGEEAVDPAAAFVLTSMLRDVVDRGTGTAVRAAGFRGPAAGKTGTTNAATDVWFVGYTPELVGAVWMGLDRPATIVRGASGGTLAAPVWGRMMRRIQGGDTPREWSPPRGVTTAQVDRATGQVVSEGCPSSGATYTEYFVRSAPPGEVCYPAGQYPAMAGGDTLWRDEEWMSEPLEPLPGDTFPVPELRDRGIYWPELEERRDDGTPPPPAPLPTIDPPERSRVGGITPVPAPGTETRRREDAAPTAPSREPWVTGEPVRRPSPRQTEERRPTEERREPQLLGRPVERPPAAPAPPDTSARP